MPELDLSDALSAARSLLGCLLIHESEDGITSGIIVETEAYLNNDPASHTFGGVTKRNAVMFGPAGHAYIYFTYGMHYCFNVVTGAEGDGQAVLIRALEPVDGIELMKQRRGMDNLQQLTNGPAKLVQAMGITKSDYGINLRTGKLRIEATSKAKDVVEATRIGITKGKDELYRFYLRDNLFVSRK